VVAFCQVAIRDRSLKSVRNRLDMPMLRRKILDAGGVEGWGLGRGVSQLTRGPREHHQWGLGQSPSCRSNSVNATGDEEFMD